MKIETLSTKKMYAVTIDNEIFYVEDDITDDDNRWVTVSGPRNASACVNPACPGEWIVYGREKIGRRWELKSLDSNYKPQTFDDLIYHLVRLTQTYNKKPDRKR